MRITYSYGGLHLIFHVHEDGCLDLLYLDRKPAQTEPEAPKNKWFRAAAIHVAGGNPDDHHGAKFSVCSGGESLKYVSHQILPTPDGEQLEFVLRDEQLEAVLHYRFYRDFPVLRSWTTVKNISREDVGLEYVGSFAWMDIEGGAPQEDLRVLIPHNAWQRECSWKSYRLPELGLSRCKTLGFSTKRIALSNTGSWSSKEYLPMGGIERKDGLFLWQIEHNGSWHWEISDLAGGLYLKLSGPNERENGWYRCLKPGECFESVASAVAAGENLNGALGAMTDYRRTLAPVAQPDQYTPVIFNDYMNCLKADPTEEKEYPMIDRAAEAGAEYYVMDAGWYADGTWWDTVGQWQPCHWRFPNGIRKVFDYVREKGMLPGIWLEIESMGIRCPILDEFEDSCFFLRHGKRVIDHGRYQLDFRHPKVRRFATGVVDRLVGEYGICYIKLDYNIDIGIGTEVDADSFGDGLLRSNRAFLSWLEEIRTKYPHLVLECCASGGMRMDYATLSQCALYSVTDQTDYIENARVAQAAPMALLPEQGAIWAYPVAKDSIDGVAVNMVNAMLQRIHLSGQLRDLDAAQFALVQEGVRCYKETRAEIRNSRAFYPCGLPEYERKWLCVGYEGPKRRYLKVWRLDSEEEMLTVPVCGATARVLYPSNTKAMLQGSEKTLQVTLPEKNTAVFIELTERRGKP